MRDDIEQEQRTDAFSLDSESSGGRRSDRGRDHGPRGERPA